MKGNPLSLTASEAQIGCGICGDYPHLEWCEKIAGKIYDRFNSTYKEIYNVIELSLDEKRAEMAKSLIGHELTETRNDCTKFVTNYFSDDGKL